MFIGLSVPAFASAPEGLIRCPDWQRYAPLTVLARPADAQTPARFDARTGRTDVTRPRQVGAQTSRASACTRQIRAGDTLGRIAARHLGSAARWPEIAAANPGVKPTALRPGTTLNLPCAVPAPTSAAARTASQTTGQTTGQGPAPRIGTGFLARLFGAKPADTRTAAVKPAEAAPKPSATPAAATPKPAPLPLWTARAGEDFAAVLARWGKEAGYRVVTGTTDAWTLRVPVRLRGDFETVVSRLVNGFGSDGRAPPVRIYANKVIRIGGLP